MHNTQIRSYILKVLLKTPDFITLHDLIGLIPFNKARNKEIQHEIWRMAGEGLLEFTSDWKISKKR